MSIYFHFRAVAQSEIRNDHTWLAAFMAEAWENHPDEYAIGIANSINKVFGSIDDLYAAAGGLDAFDAGADKPWELPIYGGRPVPHSAGADPSNPPLGILEPPGVSRAADFLTAVPFDQLWNVAGTESAEAARRRRRPGRSSSAITGTFSGSTGGRPRPATPWSKWCGRESPAASVGGVVLAGRHVWHCRLDHRRRRSRPVV